MTPTPFKFDFEDYKLFCDLFELKMSKYDTLKAFSRFVELSKIEVYR